VCSASALLAARRAGLTVECGYCLWNKTCQGHVVLRYACFGASYLVDDVHRRDVMLNVAKRLAQAALLAVALYGRPDAAAHADPQAGERFTVFAHADTEQCILGGGAAAKHALKIRRCAQSLPAPQLESPPRHRPGYKIGLSVAHTPL